MSWQGKTTFSSGKVLLLVGLGVVVLGSCVVCGGGLALLMMASDVKPAAAPPTVPAGVAGGAAVAPEGAGADDFIYRAPNGSQYVPTVAIVERGKAVTLAGTWREDHRGFLLVLGGDGAYRCEEMGSSGNTAAGTAESGEWSLVEGKLHLVPASVKLRTINGTRQMMEDLKVGPARDMTVEGLSLEYTPYGEPKGAPRRIEGIAIEGEVPAWSYSMTGRWKWVLRRAGGERMLNRE